MKNLKTTSKEMERNGKRKTMTKVIRAEKEGEKSIRYAAKCNARKNLLITGASALSEIR